MTHTAGIRPPFGDPARVRRALEAIAAGQPVAVVDEEREAGDLIVEAELVTPALMAFLVRHDLGARDARGPRVDVARTGLFVLAPDMYPESVRTTAVGWAAAFGRLGAITSPILVGILVDRSWTPSALFALFAVPTALAAIAVLAMTRPSAATGHPSASQLNGVSTS